MLITVCSVREGAAKFDEAVLRYLQQVHGTLTAEQRTFRSPEELLQHVATRQKQRGAVQLWLLHSAGEQRSSEQFAADLRQARDQGCRNLYLAVGPADGWSRQHLAEAQRLISLGAMTLPHELARLVLAEQVYRASTILAGHPYHLGH